MRTGRSRKWVASLKLPAWLFGALPLVSQPPNVRSFTTQEHSIIKKTVEKFYALVVLLLIQKQVQMHAVAHAFARIQGDATMCRCIHLGVASKLCTLRPSSGASVQTLRWRCQRVYMLRSAIPF